MNPQLTPEQAIQILSDALQPQMQGQITRQGYIAIEQAIQIIAAAIKQESDHSKTHPQDAGTSLL